MISIKNVILPNKPLNNFELEDAAKRLKIPSFRGVFLLDRLRIDFNLLLGEILYNLMLIILIMGF